MTEWKQPPRPVLARTLQAGVWLMRLWALPIFVVAWVVGVIAQAAALGFAVAWECAAIEWARSIYYGKSAETKKSPVLANDWDDDGDDD